MSCNGRAAAAALGLILLLFGTAVADDDLPTFRVEKAELDLGTIMAGSVATATFIFHNDGPEDVHIIRAKPS